jgi:Ca2+-binding EF-hand superfamily protein
MSSIGSIGSSLASSMSGARPQRPDPTKMANQLFAQLDSKGQGFIEKSDLQSAFSQISGTISSSIASSATGSSASVDDVFSQLDADDNGKVTKDEMSSSMKKLADELDSQFNQMRMSGGMGGMSGPGGAGGPGGMPPPPPPGGDEGLSKDELTHQLSEIGSSDSKRSDLMSKVVNNFDAADTDGNGKVSFQEAMAYDQQSSTGSTTSSDNTSAAAASSESTRSSSSTSNDLAIMKRIMDLMQAYGSSDASGTNVTSGLLSTLSVSV